MCSYFRQYAIALALCLCGSDLFAANPILPARKIDWTPAGVEGGIPARNDIYTTLAPLSAPDLYNANYAGSSLVSARPIGAGHTYRAVKFTAATTYNTGKIVATLNRSGTVSGTVTVEIVGDGGGSTGPLASGTGWTSGAVNVATLGVSGGATGDLVVFDLNAQLTSGSIYWLVLHANITGAGHLDWGDDGSTPTVINWTSTDGTSWTADTISSLKFGIFDNDDTNAIQAALNSCPADKVVLLTPGTFNVAGTIVLYAHHVLKGFAPDGPFATVIQQTAETGGILAIGGYFGLAHPLLAADAPGGSNTVTLVNPVGTTDIYTDSLLQVGNVIAVTQYSYPPCSGDSAIDGCDGVQGVPQGHNQGQQVRVTARSGRNVTFTPALYPHGYTTASSAQVEFQYATGPENLTEWAGIESLKVACMNIVATPNDTHTAIGLTAAANCWVKNVWVDNFYYAAIHYQETYHCTVKHNHISNGSAPTSGGGRGYGILGEDFATANLVEDNISYLVESPFILGYGTEGNVLAYNYEAQGTYGGLGVANISMSLHDAQCNYNAAEGNVVKKLEADNFHGGVVGNTFWRNWFYGSEFWTTVGRWCAALDTGAYDNNLIGNVLGVTGTSFVFEPNDPTDPRDASVAYVRTLGYRSSGGAFVQDAGVASSTAWHANYDAAHGSIVYESGNTNVTDHTITAADLDASLYLTGRPSWFYAGLSWPPIKAEDGLPVGNVIPAMVRWAAGTPLTDPTGTPVPNKTGMFFAM